MPPLLVLADTHHPPYNINGNIYSSNVLFQDSEELVSGVVINAMLEVEKLLDTVLLVLGVVVVLSLLCLGDSLNTLVKVVLEIVAGTLSGGYVSMWCGGASVYT